MATTTTRRARKPAGRISGDDLVRLLELTRGADSVELKATLDANKQRQVTSALDIDALEAQIRQVFFFDTPELALNKSGVVVRARRVQGRRGDTVVKLRPVVPDELPESVRTSGSVTVEVDAMPGGFVCSASMKGKAENKDVREVASGGRPLRKLLTKEQRQFYAAHAPEGLALDELSLLGPVFVLKVVLTPKDLGRRLVGELWLLPDGTRIVELSTKCEPAMAFQAAAETRAYLEGLGLELAPDPHTKTKSALEFFAGELSASG